MLCRETFAWVPRVSSGSSTMRRTRAKCDTVESREITKCDVNTFGALQTHGNGRNSFLAPAVCDFAMILLGFRKCQMRRQRISASPVAQNAIPVLLCLTSLGSPPGCTKRVDVASRTFARCNSIALRARRMLRTPFPCVSSAPNVLTSHFRIIASYREMQQYRTSCSSIAQNSIPVRFKCHARGREMLQTC